MFFFFFFKQKTAYEIGVRLVGSEMCIRDRAQAIQFLPIVVLPAFLLSGVFWPIQAIPAWLRPVSYIIPTTYAVDAVRSVIIRGWGLDKIYPDVVALLIFASVFLVLATLLLRRRE